MVIVIYTFEVPGNPVGKERARKREGRGFYTPEKTVDYEEKIRKAFLEKYPMLDDHDHRWRLVVWIDFSKETHPDGDNVLKCVKDALQAPRRKNKNLIGELYGYLWHDDSQVWEGRFTFGKIRSGNERITILAEPMGRLK